MVAEEESFKGVKYIYSHCSDAMGTEVDGAACAVEARISILTVNDVYCDYPIHGKGGWANLATMLAEYRERNENTLFAVIGDVLGGSALQEMFNGDWVVQVLNELKTDMACLGKYPWTGRCWSGTADRSTLLLHRES